MHHRQSTARQWEEGETKHFRACVECKQALRLCARLQPFATTFAIASEFLKDVHASVRRYRGRGKSTCPRR
jgi:hypothetical protein